MRKVFISFFPDNLELLMSGKKTTTLRSDKQAAEIAMEVGERCVFLDFVVEYMGRLHITEIPGGRDYIWETEGFQYTPPKFLQTIRFLDGQEKLHLYKFSKNKS